jgi:hypothetical protein
MNAKEELLEELEGKRMICAILSYRSKKYILKKGYTDSEFTSFIESLDFKYDDGYGSQELDGSVWLEEGLWMTRGEYDGSEWWDWHKSPEIPEELI